MNRWISRELILSTAVPRSIFTRNTSCINGSLCARVEQVRETSWKHSRRFRSLFTGPVCSRTIQSYSVSHTCRACMPSCDNNSGGSRLLRFFSETIAKKAEESRPNFVVVVVRRLVTACTHHTRFYVHTYIHS